MGVLEIILQNLVVGESGRGWRCRCIPRRFFAADATFDFLTLRAFLGSVFLEVVTGV